MKKKCLRSFILLTLVFCIVGCKEKKADFFKIENQLVDLYENDYVAFADKFTELILSDSSTINYPFQILEDNTSLKVSTSEDGNLRFYSWITPYGGTMFDYCSIVQYRDKGEIFSKECCQDSYDEENDEFLDDDIHPFKASYLKIHTVKATTKNYYLVETWERYDSGHGIGSINAFSIQDGKLKAVELFKTKTNILKSIDIEYNFRDWYFTTNNGEGFDWIFSFDRETNVLYVPLIYNDISFGYVTDQYLLYQFKNDYFQYIGKDGGYWLHSSVRNFRYLVGLFETENFKVRIDNIGKDKYRYVSWSEGYEMSEKPDLILENGVKIDYKLPDLPETYCEYLFKNGSYVYRIIGEESNCFHAEFLIVENDGQEIVQERVVDKKL